MTATRLGGLLAGAGIFLTAAAPPATRELFVVKEFPAFKVMVPQQKSAWCGSTANVTIVGQSGEQFRQNEAVLQRIVGGLRAVMSFECPEATKIQLVGLVEDQPLYQAYASASGNWTLQGAEFRSAADLRRLADMDAVAKCDELGAHPDDPEALTAGVSDSALDGRKIVEVCQKAVAADANAPRLKYQLARGLLKTDHAEAAVEQLLPAAEAGHGGSLALLGDIHLNGAAGIDADPVAAKALYAKAAAAKFQPAQAMLAKFEDQTATVAQAEAEAKREAQASRVPAARPPRQAASTARGSASGLNTQGYEYPKFMAAIYAGDYANTGFNRRFTQIYAVNMADAMRQVCRGSFTIAELNGWRRTIMSEVDTFAQAGGEAIMNALQRMAQIASGEVSAMDVAADSADVQAIPQQAQEDAMTFMGRNDCGSAAFARFTGNMREAVK